MGDLSAGAAAMALLPLNYTPYAALRGCDTVANTWCDRHCPHFAEFGSLLARYDAAEEIPMPQHHSSLPTAAPKRAWRCYARHTLDEQEDRYTSGKAYCTRHSQLEPLIESCVMESSSTASAVAVDADGGTSPPAASFSIAAEDEHNATRFAVSEDDGDEADVQTPRIGLVVSHCHESLEWLGEVQRGLRDGHGEQALALELHVYEKCGDVSEDS